MFGLEILDVVIGLMFVYLLLSLLATAINEYISAVMNLRGKELARGLGRLLDDLDEKDAVQTAFDGVKKKATVEAGKLTEQFYNHPLIRPLATRRGLFFSWGNRPPRLPSYIPARTFAMALLDVLKVREHDADLNRAASETSSPPAERRDLLDLLAILKRESPLDVNEHLKDLNGLLGNADLPPQVKLRLVDALTGTQTQLQKLHDSVEVWFNNSMDRVSGAYKRTIQGWLFIIGLLIAVGMNADTIDMWRRLAADDELRNAMVRRAEATVAALDMTLTDSVAAARTLASTPSSAVSPTPIQAPTQTDSPAISTSTAAATSTTSDSARLAAVEQARSNYLASRARLDSMELKLGWTKDDARRAGLWRLGADKPDLMPFDRPGFWAKVLGLLLTALAISLGAPFWFDLLNKVISIRGSGRSPEEKPKSPQGPAKRAAEETPK